MPALDDVASIRTSDAPLAIDAGGTANLVFGIDLLPGGSTRGYLHDASSLQVELELAAANFASSVFVNSQHVPVSLSEVKLANGVSAPAVIQAAPINVAGDKYTADLFSEANALVQATGSASVLLAFPDIPVDSQPGQFDLVLDLATGSYTLDTCDLASHLDIDSVTSDMSALPDVIRKYYRLLQTAVSGAILDMNLPLAGQGLRNSSHLVGQGELIAQALEDEFALGDRSPDRGPSGTRGARDVDRGPATHRSGRREGTARPTISSRRRGRTQARPPSGY